LLKTESQWIKCNKEWSSLQPIADRVEQNLEIISETCQRIVILPMGFTISTTNIMMLMRNRILMGFIVYYLVLIVIPMGRIMVR